MNANINHKSTSKIVPIETFRNMDLFKNVRIPDVASYDLGPLMEDIKERGLQEEPWVLKTGPDTYEPIKGFRRLSALIKLKDLHPNGFQIPGTNDYRTFDKVGVRVFEGLTEHEKIDLMLDHGQRKGLSKVELQYAFERGFSAQYTEKDLVVVLKSLLQQYYPPSKQIENTPEAYLNYYRGVVQTARRVFESPDVLRDAWLKKLQGQQKWPTTQELTELHKIHQQEAKDDLTRTINKKNPGPKFMERWNSLVALKATTPEGERPKSDAMMNRQQTEDCQKLCDSLILKRVYDVQTRKVDASNLSVLDKIQQRLETFLTPEEKQLIIGMGTTAPATQTTK